MKDVCPLQATRTVRSTRQGNWDMTVLTLWLAPLPDTAVPRHAWLSIEDGVAAGCVGNEAAMGEHGPLGDSGRSRCVTQRGYVCWLRGNVRSRVLLSCLDDSLQGHHLGFYT